LLSCRNAHPFTRNALNASYPRLNRPEPAIKVPPPTGIRAPRNPPRSRFAPAAFAKVAGARQASPCATSTIVSGAALATPDRRPRAARRRAPARL